MMMQKQSLTARPAPVVYALRLARPLPRLDLTCSVGRVWFGAQWDEWFLDLMRQRFGVIGPMFRVGGVLFLAIIFTSKQYGQVLAVLGSLFQLPMLACVLSMMSVDMLRVLWSEHEFMIFSLINACNWVIVATVVRDVRCIAALVCFLATELIILNDALFRTAEVSYKNMMLSATALVVIGAAAYVHELDSPPSNYLEFQVALAPVEITDVMLNLSFTLVLLTARILHRRRRMLSSLTAGLIPCSVLRAKLHLERMEVKGPSTTSRYASTQRKGTGYAPKSSGRTHEAAHDNSHPHLQQAMLVPLPVESVDAASTVWPGGTPSSPLSPSWRWCQRLLGTAGLILSLVTTFLPSGNDIDVKVRDFQWSQPEATTVRAIPMFALVCTLLYTMPFMFSYQRSLLRLLLRNFDVLFIMWQFAAASIALVDILELDYRCWATLAWNFWHTWVVLQDAVLPCVQEHFGHRKRTSSSVTLFIIVMTLYMVIRVLGSTTASSLRDRKMFQLSIRGTEVSMHTQSFYVNRLLIVLVWHARILWETVVCAEEELVFIKGNVEYLCPLEMFPVVKAPRSVVPVTTSVNDIACDGIGDEKQQQSHSVVDERIHETDGIFEGS